MGGLGCGHKRFIASQGKPALTAQYKVFALASCDQVYMMHVERFQLCFGLMQGASKLNVFQQLLIVKAFRPDRLAGSMAAFVCNTLNVRSVAPPPFSLKARCVPMLLAA